MCNGALFDMLLTCTCRARIPLYIYTDLTKYLHLFQECTSNREEIKKLRRDNSTLEADNHEKEKAINQLKTRVAVLEQELHDKEQVRRILIAFLTLH